MRNCRQIAELIVAREDRRLEFGERLSLRMHLAVCRRCPTFERQILAMRHMLHAWRAHVEHDPD